jgi:hypothetical protein
VRADAPGEQKTTELVKLQAGACADNANRCFAIAIPNASVAIHVTNPEGWGKFVEGAEYHVDFTPVGKTGAAAEGQPPAERQQPDAGESAPESPGAAPGSGAVETAQDEPIAATVAAPTE